ncbi:unnamed protein product [Schistosoma mattheei]|uniref:Uncharacterized protein n=1 Tax=Schistosoma mattheei TaxID=31246 RepID=A0A183PGZ4_9TREM|nr:unnamed protein product [Schistosoma mattheei]
MVDGDSWQATLDLGFVLFGIRQQGVPVILRELVLPDGSDSVSPSFTVRDVTTELSGPRPTSCRTEMEDKKNNGISGANSSLSNLKTVIKPPLVLQYP